MRDLQTGAAATYRPSAVARRRKIQKRSKQKQKKDELAAVFILQNYLDYKGDH